MNFVFSPSFNTSFTPLRILELYVRAGVFFVVCLFGFLVAAFFLATFSLYTFFVCVQKNERIVRKGRRQESNKHLVVGIDHLLYFAFL